MRDKDSQEDYGSNSDANISDLGSSKNASSSATPQSMHTPLEFSEEQVAIFTRRNEEGYDVFVDKHYVAWLEINHPGIIPPEKSPCQLSDVFSHVSPPEPVRQGFLSLTPCINSQSERPHPLTSCVTPTTAGSVPSMCLSPTLRTMPSTTDSPSVRPHRITSSVTPTTTGRIAEAHTKEVSSVSKYLALPSVAAKKKLPSAASSRVITGARVLTITQCLAILKEKEEKKKKQEEKKEERRFKEVKKSKEKKRSKESWNKKH